MSAEKVGRDCLDFGRMLLLITLISGFSTYSRADSPKGPSVPTALEFTSNGQLLVALRDSRAIATIDPRTRRVVREWPVGFRPHSIAIARSNADRILVGGTDGEFALFSANGRELHRFTSGRGPTRVLTIGSNRAVAASLWDDSIRFLDLESREVVATHRLTFSPNAMVLAPGNQLIVADAFKGNLVSLDPGHPGMERYLKFPGVNLHGLAISGDGRELLVIHMVQDGAGPLTRTNLDWGLVFSSKLTYLRLSEFEVSGRPVNFRRLTLDGSGNGAADPSAIAVSAGGRDIFIALSGANRVLRIDRSRGPKTAADLLPIGESTTLQECSVGRSPSALAVSPDGTFAVTADAMSDTLSFLTIPDLSPLETLKVGPEQPDRSPAQRGEILFRDGELALDRWMSCASCHPGGHTNGLNFDTLGDGDHGDAKNSPTLFGVGTTAPFAWTGRFKTLDEQVQQSITSSLQGDSPDAATVGDLVAYLQTLPLIPPKRDPSDPEVAAGAEVFEARNCATCHTPAAYTSKPLRDVGFRDRFEKVRLFNPPSLRGVARTAPYLHDGRATTLDDVLKIHHPGFGAPPSEEQRKALASFLESL